MPWDDKTKSGGPWGGSGGSGGGDNNEGGSPWSRPGGTGSGGGKNPESPDLEEQMRRMQARFRNRRNGGGGGGGGRRGGRGSFPELGPAGIGIVAGLGVLAWLSTGIVMVDEGSKAAIFRLGNFQTNFGPGFHVHLPYPIEQHEMLPASRQQTTDVGSVDQQNLMLTGDESIVAVSFRVVWFYDTTNPEKFILEIERGGELVPSAAESVMREVVGKSKLTEVITTGRNRIQDDVKRQLQALLNDYKAGVNVESIEIFEAAAPEQVRAAFSDVVKASQDAETKRSQAERYANDIVPRARGEALKIKQDAEAYRDQVIADATGQASRFDAIYAEYRQAPQVTRERMYLETMERVLKDNDKLVLDSQSGAVPYLPLDRVQRTQPEGQ